MKNISKNMVKFVLKTKKFKENNLVTFIRNKIEEYARVLRVARKPEKDEIKLLFKITVIGLTLVCIFAFIVKTIAYLLGGI